MANPKHTLLEDFPMKPEQKGNDEFSFDNISDDEYDALNDETFGDTIDGDWEESHDKYAQMLTDIIGEENSQESETNRVSSFLDFSISDAEDETDTEIASKNISQLSVKDDTDDKIISRLSRCHNIWNDNSVASFSSSSHISDPFYCSPKADSIWNANSSISHRQMDDSSYLKTISSSLPFKLPDNVSSAAKKIMTVDELERQLLPSTESTNKPINKDNQGISFEKDILTNLRNIPFMDSPKSVTADENNQRIGFIGSRIREDVELENIKPPMVFPSNLPCDILSGAKTLDEIEKDMLATSIPTNQEVIKQAKPIYRCPQPIARPPTFMVRPPFSGFPPGMFSVPPPRVQMPTVPREQQFRDVMVDQFQFVPPALRGAHLIDPRRMNLPFARPNNQMLPQEWFGGTKVGLVPSVAEYKKFASSGYLPYPQADPCVNYDDYADLMTRQEKDWLLRVQLMFLDSMDPQIGDYYYSNFFTRKCNQELAAKGELIGRSSPKLLLPERAKVETKTYVPTQFEGSLGKLQSVNFNCPRQILGVSVKRPAEDDECDYEELRDVNAKNHMRFRFLLDIEKLYNHLLEIDDEKKRILALPEIAHQSHFENITLHTTKLFDGLGCEDNIDTFQNLMSIRKGRTLGVRCFKVFSKNQRSCFLKALFRCSICILRKDQHDLILMNNIVHFANFIKTMCLEDLVSLIQSFEEPYIDSNAIANKSNRDKNILAIILKSGFGFSIICCMLQQAEFICSDNDSRALARWEQFVMSVADIMIVMPNMTFVPLSISADSLLDHFRRFEVSKEKLDFLKSKLLIKVS